MADAVDHLAGHVSGPVDGLGQALAQHAALGVLGHVHVVGRVHDAVTAQHLAEVFRLVDGAIGGSAHLDGTQDSVRVVMQVMIP